MLIISIINLLYLCRVFCSNSSATPNEAKRRTSTFTVSELKQMLDLVDEQSHEKQRAFTSFRKHALEAAVAQRLTRPSTCGSAANWKSTAGLFFTSRS